MPLTDEQADNIVTMAKLLDISVWDAARRCGYDKFNDYIQEIELTIPLLKAVTRWEKKQEELFGSASPLAKRRREMKKLLDREK